MKSTGISRQGIHLETRAGHSPAHAGLDISEQIHRAIGGIIDAGLSLGLVVVDDSYKIIHWNGWMEKHSGVKQKKVLGRHLLEQCPEIQTRGKNEYLTACLERQSTALLSPIIHKYFIELPVVRGNKSIPMFQNVKIFPFLKNGIPSGAIIIIQDMTEGILHEKEIARLTRILNGIRNVNKLMGQVTTEDDLLTGVCEILVRDIGYPLAWIAMVQEGVFNVKAASIAEVHSDILKKVWFQCGGDCPMLQERAETFICGGRQAADSRNKKKFSRSCLGLEKEMGIQFTCNIPLKFNNILTGVIHICTAEPHCFQSEEMDLLHEFVSDIIFAVETIRDRQRRMDAESALKESEARLRQSQKMEAVGVLAGGIAHDFNNILFPIIGFAEMIAEDVPPESESHTFIQEVLHAAIRARDLVKQILSFSRQNEIVSEPVILSSIVKEALKLMRASIPSTIEIRQNIDNNCGQVLSDPTQIYQVVMNLCTNAYQAMEEKGNLMEVSLQQADLPEELLLGNPPWSEGYILLRVKDTGCGMDEKTVERIFEPYFTTKFPGKGTGLGLALVYGIVSGAGGYIRVISDLGIGTTFDVYFPRMPSITRNMAGTELYESFQMGHERILMVDDEPQITRMVYVNLQRLGYRVTEVNDSGKALTLFADDPHAFDLVITDLTMPGLTGDNLAQKILQIRPDMPVIMCSGFQDKITPEIIRNLGIKRVMLKPVARHYLARTIRETLDNDKERA
jgi:signal transduction histidine kinase/CheY-like chemotaxis protein